MTEKFVSIQYLFGDDPQTMKKVFDGTEKVGHNLSLKEGQLVMPPVFRIFAGSWTFFVPSDLIVSIEMSI